MSSQRLSRLLLLALAALLLVPTVACDDEEEFEHNFTFVAPLRLDGRFGDEVGGTPATMDLTPVEVVVPVNIDLGEQNATFAELKSSGKLQDATVTRVAYNVQDNSANTDFSDIVVAFGPLDLDSVAGQGAAVVARVPQVKAGETVMGEAELDSAGISASRPLLLDLAFGVATGANFAILEGETVPSGTIMVEVDVFIRLTASTD